VYTYALKIVFTYFMHQNFPVWIHRKKIDDDDDDGDEKVCKLHE
jgi:hypothetical protein